MQLRLSVHRADKPTVKVSYMYLYLGEVSLCDQSNPVIGIYIEER